MSLRPTAAALALQAALTQAFAADATLAGLTRGRIHDGPGRATVVPYLAFAGLRTRDFSSGDGSGARVILTLEAVTGDGDRTRALTILDAALAVATDPALAITGGRLVLLTVTATEVERLKSGDRWRARATIEALIDG
jgi:hypothetical protein